MTISLMDSFGELRSVPWVPLLTASILVWLCVNLFAEPKTPGGIPWIGRRKEPFSYLRAKFRFLTSSKEVLLEAVQHHKHGRVVLCAMPIGPPQIVLPPDQLHWMVTQPASVISQDPLVNDVHKFLGTGMDGDLTLAELLRKELARNDERILIVYEEIATAINELWGTSEDWRNVDLRSTIRMVNARVANRIYVGLPLCRDDRYLRHIMGFTGTAGIGTAIYPLLPRILVPLASAIVKAINRHHIQKCAQLLLPIMRERFVSVETLLRGGKTSPTESRLPDDLMTWLVKKSVQSGENEANVEDRILSRLVVANLPAIEASTNALSKSILDLLVLADHDKHLMPIMREAAAALESCNFRPDKQIVSSMERIDKAIKETLRRESLVGLPRQITAPQGVTLAGAHIPCGARVYISAVGIHFDEDIYANADEYDPFRNEVVHRGTVKADKTSTERATDLYISFGFGRRACPGRFLIADQMKLIIAHILTKYEIEAVGGNKSKGPDSIRIRYKSSVEL